MWCQWVLTLSAEPQNDSSLWIASLRGQTSADVMAGFSTETPAVTSLTGGVAWGATGLMLWSQSCSSLILSVILSVAPSGSGEGSARLVNQNFCLQAPPMPADVMSRTQQCDKNCITSILHLVWLQDKHKHVNIKAPKVKVLIRIPSSTAASPILRF